MKSSIISPHVYLLRFSAQYDLCMSFVRIQEFYESPNPKIRGKYFTLEQYIDYWSKEFGKGSFTYPSVWNGFNVPGKVLYDWWDKFEEHSDIRVREKYVFEEIYRLMDKEVGFYLEDDIKKIYVIAVNNESCNKKVIEHELAHAFFTLYKEYRGNCKKLIKGLSIDEKNDAKEALLKMGYGDNTVDDEMQAYFSTGKINGGAWGGKSQFIDNFKLFKNKLK